MLATFIAFLGVSALVIMTPGPDTAVTISGTLGGGRRGGVFTALGVFCGLSVWTLATSAGIAALLVASEPAFLTLKYLGAAYLLYLGAHGLWTAFRRGPHRDETPGDDSDEGPGGEAGGRRRRALVHYRRGLLSDLGNPKIAVFFTSLLPQFGTHFIALTLLGLVFCTMTFLWLVLYTAAIAKMGGLLRRPAVRRALDAVTGAVLAALGVRLALEPR